MSTNPPKPNLEFYRKQAKALLHAARAGDISAIERLRRAVPRLHRGDKLPPSDLALHDAQLALAREQGFASWPAMRAALVGTETPARKYFRPHVRGFSWYEERVAGIVSMHASGLPEAMASIRRSHPRLAGNTDAQIQTATFSEEDAKLVLAREHGHATWEAFKSHIEAIERSSIAEPFTAAFDAIKAGDASAMDVLLRDHPDLLDAQGTNGSSLLNLAVALKQPAICKLLIDGGADVDLPTSRGLTPLHEAAYHNRGDLVEMLLEAGASPEACAYGDGGTPLMMALFWGNDWSRESLARLGIFPNNLRAAAGAGRLDLVEQCFNGNDLTADATAHRAFHRPHTGFPIWAPTESRQEVLDEAFVYAGKNGQTAVLEFLLAKGADINSDPYRGTALTWAVWKGRVDTALWLLDHGADANRRATFGGPSHGKGHTALHAAAECGRLDLARLLIERGADASIQDEIYKGTPAGWAEHFGKKEVLDYLRAL